MLIRDKDLARPKPSLILYITSISIPLNKKNTTLDYYTNASSIKIVRIAKLKRLEYILRDYLYSSIIVSRL